MNKEALRKKINSLDALSKEEKAELTELLNTKRYGLVWEDKPEAVEEELKTQLPVLQEVAERKIIGSRLSVVGSQQSALGNQPVVEMVKPQISLDFGTDDNIRTGLKDFQDSQDLMIDKNNPEHPVKSLNPVLTSSVNHALIEGDNLHALTVLNYTHANKIDVIYIDPPYNTGNKDFKYNDHFVDKEDGYRHSKWLSFMAKRLRLAKNLLSDKGVIFISIDENEVHNLRLLMDEIFGELNFVEQLIWNKRIPKNDKGIGNIHESILLYAKDYSLEHSFTQKKDGIEDVNQFVSSLAKKKIPIPESEKEVKKFFNKNGYDRGITLYNSLDKDYQLWGKINVSWPNAKTIGPRYDVLHPKTLKPSKVPDRGWRFTRETFDNLLDYENVIEHHDGTFTCGKIWFAKDENTQPSTIKYLNEVNDFLLRSILSTKSDGSNELTEIIGTGKFDYPKPIDLIERLINSVNNKNATILDFFAGSGTTLHAVMALNAEDGGSRQCILVTNNENNICQEVTYERNKRVIEGYTNAKGESVAGLGGNNLRYYRTGYVRRERTLKNKKALVNLATEMLCLKEGVYQESSEMTTKQIRVFEDNDKAFMIIYDEEFIDDAVALIQRIEIPNPIKVYVFANGQYPYTEDFEEVLDKIELCALPDAIYRAYQRLLPKEESITNL